MPPTANVPSLKSWLNALVAAQDQAHQTVQFQLNNISNGVSALSNSG